MTRIHLTEKERQAAGYVAAGLTNKQIAATMGVTGQRVRVLISAVAYKIGADASKHERVQVALWWHANEAATVAKGYSA